VGFKQVYGWGGEDTVTERPQANERDVRPFAEMGEKLHSGIQSSMRASSISITGMPSRMG
jgi:hypothetical protein